MRRSVLVGLATTFAVMLLLMVVTIGPGRAMSRSNGSDQWTVVFSDTFSLSQDAWTIMDVSGSGYQWGRTTYTSALGVQDEGLWAAGGGSSGSTQSWFTGTYTNNMATLAMAGPFTLTRAATAVSLTFGVFNELAAGDSLSVALSTDGSAPLDAWYEVPISTTWQEIGVATGGLPLQTPLWILLRFVSDGTDVARGPLVDDIALQVRVRYDVYMPLIRKDPTPTPIPVYFDDFSDPASGWHTGWAQRPVDPPYVDYYGNYHEEGTLENVAQLSYGDGHYRIYIPMDYRGWGDIDSWFVWPAETAPLPAEFYPLPDHYCITARARFVTSQDYSPWWAHWGIVFGANASLSEIYTFQINANHNLGIVGFHNYTYPGDRCHDCGHDIEWPIYQWPGTTDRYWSYAEFGNPAYQYNVLKVEVTSNVAHFYVNGAKVATAGVYIESMPRARIGLIGGDFEVTPVEIEFDYFRYEPYCGSP